MFACASVMVVKLLFWCLCNFMHIYNLMPLMCLPASLCKSIWRLHTRLCLGHINLLYKIGESLALSFLCIILMEQFNVISVKTEAKSAR